MSIYDLDEKEVLRQAGWRIYSDSTLKSMTKDELNEILKLHKMWMNGEEGGVRANLWLVDLRGMDFSDADAVDCADSCLHDVLLLRNPGSAGSVRCFVQLMGCIMPYILGMSTGQIKIFSNVQKRNMHSAFRLTGFSVPKIQYRLYLLIDPLKVIPGHARSRPVCLAWQSL